MNTTIKATITRKHAERLNRLAFRYGLSLDRFVSRLLSEVSTDIPEETLSEYQTPRKLSASIKRGLADWTSGRVSSKL